MGVKHKKPAISSDGPNDGRVLPSWWNEDHEIGDYLGALFVLATTPSTFAYIKEDGTAGNAAITEFARLAFAAPSAAEFAAALGAAPTDSPLFTGEPRVPTVLDAMDNSTRVASTEFVQMVRSAMLTLLAPKNSAQLTGAPTAPTPTFGDTSTRIATMAALAAAIAALDASDGDMKSSDNLLTLTDKVAALGNLLYKGPRATEVARPAIQKIGEVPSVKDFGAFGNGGVNDDWLAFQRAANEGIPISVPMSVNHYKIGQTIECNYSYTAFRGATRRRTVIMGYSNAAPLFQIAPGLGYLNFEDLWLHRNVTPTGSATGINCPGRVEEILINRCRIENQYTSLNLGPTGFSQIKDTSLIANYGDALYCTNTATDGVLQWSLFNVDAQANGNRGIFFNTSSLVSCTFGGSISGTTLTVYNMPTGNLAVGDRIAGGATIYGTGIQSQLTGTPGGIGTYSLTGPSQTVAVVAMTGHRVRGCALGEHVNIATFANSGYGVAYIGSEDVPIYGIRMSGGFIGADGNSGVFADTHGSFHNMNFVFSEAIGGSPTGPTFAVAPSGIGYGFELTNSNYDVGLLKPVAITNQSGGIYTAVREMATIIGARMESNAYYGMKVADGAKCIQIAPSHAHWSIAPQQVLANESLMQVIGANPASLNNNARPAYTAFTPTQSGTAPGTATGAYLSIGGRLYLLYRFAATGTGTVVLSLPAGFAARVGQSQTITGKEVGVSANMIMGNIAGGNTVFNVSAYSTALGNIAANGALFDLNGEIELA